MSSRAMKKLLRDTNGPAPLRDLEHTHIPKDTQDHHHEDNEEEEQEEEDDDDDSHLARRPPARNLFALVRHKSPFHSFAVA